MLNVNNVVKMLYKCWVCVIILCVGLDGFREVIIMNFAQEIKKIRLKKFLTQEDFAKELGVSFNTVNRWETGRAKPSIKGMKQIDEFCKKNGIDFDVSEEITKIEQ